MPMRLAAVSDYCVHNLSVPVVVIKGEEGALPETAHHAEGAAAAAVQASAAAGGAAAPAAKAD